jgi:hypothetical protein
MILLSGVREVNGGKWGQAPFSPLYVCFQNPDLVFYRTNEYKCSVDYEFVLPEK